MSEATADQLSVTRFVDAPREAIFDVLAHPTRHQETDPAPWRWVRDSVQPDAITHVGQVFAMNMYLKRAGGEYRIVNQVTAFDAPRIIAWKPGNLQDGELQIGGWEWRYELAPERAGTRVTLTYDWSATSAQTRSDFGGMPPWPATYLQESIDQLAATCENAQPAQ